MPNKRVTITDVAKLAGVSVSTASVVVNNKDKYVDPKLKQRVMEAVSLLKYEPNLVARSLKVKETRTIGLVLTNITSPVTPPFVRIIHEYANKQGFDTLIAATEENLKTENAIVRNMLSKRVDGLIICPANVNEYEHLRHASSLIPVVMIERQVPGISSVITNNQAISYRAAKHLVEHGRRKIGLIHMPLSGINTRERYNGIRQALLESYCLDPSLFVETDYMGSSAFELACDLITQAGVDAIMTTSQSIAIGAFKACKKLGVSIPDQVAIYGYDDVPWMELTTPALSTTKQPIVEMAQRAAEILFQIISSNETRPEIETIESQLIIRNSCGCA